MHKENEVRAGHGNDSDQNWVKTFETESNTESTQQNACRTIVIAVVEAYSSIT